MHEYLCNKSTTKSVYTHNPHDPGPGLLRAVLLLPAAPPGALQTDEPLPVSYNTHSGADFPASLGNTF